MNLTDTHAHLYWDSFQEDLDSVIKRSLENRVSTLINVGVDVETSQKSLNQIEEKLSKIPDLLSYSTIGIHPHESINYLTNPDVSIQDDITKLEKIYLSNPKVVVGVGECGLDYLEVDPKLKPIQTILFSSQIELAKKLGLPLSIHVRDDRTQNINNSECWDQAVKMTSDHFGVFHCYSGLAITTQKILQTNFYFSFAANITYPKNDYLREAIKIIPLDRIVLETDCPFLSPQSKRGTRNEPAAVLESANLIADLKGISLDEVAKQTSQNASKLFKLEVT